MIHGVALHSVLLALAVFYLWLNFKYISLTDREVRYWSIFNFFFRIRLRRFKGNTTEPTAVYTGFAMVFLDNERYIIY